MESIILKQCDQIKRSIERRLKTVESKLKRDFKAEADVFFDAATDWCDKIMAGIDDIDELLEAIKRRDEEYKKHEAVMKQWFKRDIEKLLKKQRALNEELRAIGFIRDRARQYIEFNLIYFNDEDTPF